MRIVEYPKSEVEIEQEKDGFYPAKWWQARDAEGKLLAETSVRSDFKQLELLGAEAQEDGVTFHRLYERRETKWVDENPFAHEIEWTVIPGFPNYEMTENGGVRRVDTKGRLKPLLIGDGGYLGFLLQKGMSVYLKGLHELYSEVFPTTDEPKGPPKSDVWWQAMDSNGAILAYAIDFEAFRPLALVEDPRVKIMQFIGGAPKMPIGSTIDITEAFLEHKRHRRDV